MERKEKAFHDGAEVLEVRSLMYNHMASPSASRATGYISFFKLVSVI
jgi:hypothetical protein